MSGNIRDISSDELTLFGSIVARLQRRDFDSDPRESIIGDVVRLLRSDASVSFFWDGAATRFTNPSYLNASPDRVKKYQDHFQFRDPWMSTFRKMSRPTPIDWIIPAQEFERSEVFNEVLAPDNLYHILGLYISHDGTDLGRLTVLRGRQRAGFEERDVGLLSVLGPFMGQAFKAQAGSSPNFTKREKEVAMLVAKGCPDRDIARILGIAFYTVRTHISNALEKAGCANRAELAGFMAANQSSN